jgi:hypothetical protein
VSRCPLVYPQNVESDVPGWACTWCGGAADDEESLLDHQDWCLGDAASNTALLRAVAERDGELTQEALVAEAQKRRHAPG